jgi:hypothetical protein
MNPSIPADGPVSRIARRKAKAGCDGCYEAIVRGMFAETARFPGFLGADLIPPRPPANSIRWSCALPPRQTSTAGMPRKPGGHGTHASRRWRTAIPITVC